MVCERCSVDKRVTVVIDFEITKIDRHGAERRVQIAKRLCRLCGGAEPVDEDAIPAPVDAVADDSGGAELAEQLELGAG